MGNRFSAVILKACDLIPARGRHSPRLGIICRVPHNHHLTSLSASGRRLSRTSRDLVHRRQCKAIVTQAAL
jgi:hypothetical protein